MNKPSQLFGKILLTLILLFWVMVIMSLLLKEILPVSVFVAITLFLRAILYLIGVGLIVVAGALIATIWGD